MYQNNRSECFTPVKSKYIMLKRSEGRIAIWSANYFTFDWLVRQIDAGYLTPLVCQGCGLIVSGEEHAEPTDALGERKCPDCCSVMVAATAKTLNEAFDWGYPWRRCEHCGYNFLFDDDVAKEVEPDPSKVEPGYMGCPNCRRLTA